MGFGDSFEEEPRIVDTLFRKKPKKHGREWPLVEAPSLGCTIADSHAHIDMQPNPPLALARAGAHNVDFIEAMVDPLSEDGNTTSKYAGWLEEAAAISFCPQAPQLRVSIGVHPHYSKDYTSDTEKELKETLRNPLVSAVGEIGLDYHYDLSPRDVQQEVFARQVEIAHEANLPVILHVREAHDDAYSIMKEVGWPRAGTLLHCYTSDADEVVRWVDAGCYVAFGGAFTFKKLGFVREAARKVPHDRFLLETDSPYMAPEPFRGMTCEPAHVIFTAARICEFLELDESEARGFLRQTFINTLNLLDRLPTPWQTKSEASLGSLRAKMESSCTAQ